MSDNYVTFVPNEHLKDCISQLYSKYLEAKTTYNKKHFNKNKVDVFKMLFDKKFNSLNEEALIEKEISRQIDRTVVNAIGDFHENILNGVEGFSGIDIKSDDNKIFIELKTNTLQLKGRIRKAHSLN
jgi:hypothetical protein